MFAMMAHTASSGAFNPSPPTAVEAFVVGAGAGGGVGGTYLGDPISPGGGGGGGGVAYAQMPVSSTDTLTATVGSKGSGSTTTSSNGGSGGYSRLVNLAGDSIYATGGGGGAHGIGSGFSVTGTTASTASSGTLDNATGGKGGSSTYVASPVGYGGGNGQNYTTITWTGSSILAGYGGPGGSPTTTSGNGNGGGGGNTSTSTVPGAAGKDGAVIIRYPSQRLKASSSSGFTYALVNGYHVYYKTTSGTGTLVFG